MGSSVHEKRFMSAERFCMPHVTKVRWISPSRRALDDISHHSKRYSEEDTGLSQPSFSEHVAFDVWSWISVQFQIGHLLCTVVQALTMPAWVHRFWRTSIESHAAIQGVFWHDVLCSLPKLCFAILWTWQARPVIEEFCPTPVEPLHEAYWCYCVWVSGLFVTSAWQSHQEGLQGHDAITWLQSGIREAGGQSDVWLDALCFGAGGIPFGGQFDAAKPEVCWIQRRNVGHLHWLLCFSFLHRWQISFGPRRAESKDRWFPSLCFGSSQRLSGHQTFCPKSIANMQRPDLQRHGDFFFCAVRLLGLVGRHHGKQTWRHCRQTLLCSFRTLEVVREGTWCGERDPEASLQPAHGWLHEAAWHVGELFYSRKAPQGREEVCECIFKCWSFLRDDFNEGDVGLAAASNGVICISSGANIVFRRSCQTRSTISRRRDQNHVQSSGSWSQHVSVHFSHVRTNMSQRRCYHTVRQQCWWSACARTRWRPVLITHFAVGIIGQQQVQDNAKKCRMAWVSHDSGLFDLHEGWRQCHGGATRVLNTFMTPRRSASMPPKRNKNHHEHADHVHIYAWKILKISGF